MDGWALPVLVPSPIPDEGRLQQKRTKLQEKDGSLKNGEFVSPCHTRIYSHKAHQFARKGRSPQHGLFEATFLRRGVPITEQRMANLEALKASGRRIRLRDLVQAFLSPVLALRSTPEGRSFLRLQARLHTEPPSVSYELRTRVYDVSTRNYVEALKSALPELPEQDVYWRMTLMVGAYLYAFSDTHRLQVAAPSLVDLDDTEAILDQVTAFVVGGLQAPPSSVASSPRLAKRVG
jgi:hypothetical protein